MTSEFWGLIDQLQRGSAGRPGSLPPKPASEPRGSLAHINVAGSGALVEGDHVTLNRPDVELARAEDAGVGIGGQLTPLG